VVVEADELAIDPTEALKAEQRTYTSNKTTASVNGRQVTNWQ
jgi:hypothetical protein